MSPTHRRTLTFTAGTKVAVKKRTATSICAPRGRLVKNTGSGRDVSASPAGGGVGGGGQEHALDSLAQNFNQPGNVSHILWIPHKGGQDLEGDWVRLTNQICY